VVRILNEPTAAALLYDRLVSRRIDATHPSLGIKTVGDLDAGMERVDRAEELLERLEELEALSGAPGASTQPPGPSEP
jgi:hypothetical protein